MGEIGGGYKIKSEVFKISLCNLMVGLSFRSDSNRYPQQMILCRADSNLDKISIIIFYTLQNL